MIIPRGRIKNKASNSTVIPSAKAWQTPKQIYISKALKADICDLISRQTIRSAQVQLTRLVGEKEILSHGRMINIVHREGRALKAAGQNRMQTAFELMPGIDAGN